MYYTYTGLKPCEEKWRWITFVTKKKMNSLLLASFPFADNSRDTMKQLNRKVEMVYNKRFLNTPGATEAPLSSGSKKGSTESKKEPTEEEKQHKAKREGGIKAAKDKLKGKTFADKDFSAQVKDAMLPALIAAGVVTGASEIGRAHV